MSPQGLIQTIVYGVIFSFGLFLTPIRSSKYVNLLFTQLGQFQELESRLSMETAKTLVHAFVTSKLDNCNALLYGLPKYKIQRLQYVLNSAARQVTSSRKHDHISPVVLMELHWLPA